MPENIPWPLIVPLLAVQLVLMCVALVSLVRSERANGPKWLWAIIIVLLNIPGTIAYLMMGRKDAA
ncbi:negative regulatory protein YxlE [Paenibacillus dendritiformis]|uniref:PLD nuclease N-terminal domain-containing protein n=1 Tax=Paenibacillus dendritiformis TaxID=130049 RepID=UPI00143DBD66|nr:PLD nuclease N-terminal domain-containing protein [Paenibacillus dendritiformis]NKI20524.1 PLDc_N domain-containing protein [Paenibacillus dendritiformis]NRF98781.1 PLDc_N domain-containing protein [Paenibacillus dendritiformis]GIO75500.1 negative regulatory protein YxlE [Paenibacillus dendritiformis]